MRAFVNFGGVFLIVLLAVLGVAAYRFFKNSDPDNLENDPDVNQEEFEKERKKTIVSNPFQGKGKKSDEQETVLTDMPVLSWKYPGKDWESKELSKVCTSIGRGSDCDIVIAHPTVSIKHAEVIMKIRKINAQKKGARYFLLKNHSKENPISFLNAEGGNDDWRDIVSSIPLTYSENAFFLGLIEMRLTFPTKKRVLSKGPDLWAQEEKKLEWNSEQKADKNYDDGISEEAAADISSSVSGQKKKMQNKPETIADSELIRVQRKVIRRSPRSGNRI